MHVFVFYETLSFNVFFVATKYFSLKKKLDPRYRLYMYVIHMYYKEYWPETDISHSYGHTYQKFQISSLRCMFVDCTFKETELLNMYAMCVVIQYVKNFFIQIFWLTNEISCFISVANEVLYDIAGETEAYHVVANEEIKSISNVDGIKKRNYKSILILVFHVQSNLKVSNYYNDIHNSERKISQGFHLSSYNITLFICLVGQVIKHYKGMKCEMVLLTLILAISYFGFKSQVMHSINTYFFLKYW